MLLVRSLCKSAPPFCSHLGDLRVWAAYAFLAKTPPVA